MPSVIDRLRTLFGSGSKTPSPVVHVVEEVVGNFHYHLAPIGSMKALCSTERTMMYANIPLEGWGYKSPHLPERYCPDCQARANQEGVVLGRAR